MKRALCVFAFAVVGLVRMNARCSGGEPATQPLKVALFGYIPDGSAAETKLHDAFSKLNTGYELEVTLVDPYHDKDEDSDLKTLVQHFTDFDVVETDLCRFQDLRDGKVGVNVGLDALPAEWTWYPTQNVVAGPAKVVVSSVDFKQFTVPHWICQNFMICWADKDAENAAKLADALDPTNGKPVLADLWGSTGLGEFYANALANRVGPANAEESLRQLVKIAAKPGAGGKVKITDLDKDAREAIIALAGKLPRQFRMHPVYYHAHPEFYGWAFAKDKKAVFIGYSESLFYTKLSDDAGSTAPAPTPIGPAEVTIRPLSFTGPASKGTPSWTDGFVIPKGKLANKKVVIEKFLKFITTPEAYACFEQPEPGLAAANLLPAYEAEYQDVDVKRDEPLLATFHDSFDASFVINHSDTWNGMKLAGKALQKAIQP